jgi:putative addiction module killer protein
MVDLRTTPEFDAWLKALRDSRARAKITARVARLQNGNAGDVKPVGDGVSEMRIHTGPGYRVYFVQFGATLIVLLCGGDKASQDRDIRHAKMLSSEFENDSEKN